MIYSLKGTITHTEQNMAVVECGGVGYACRTTLNTLRDIKVGAEATLYTYMSVREDAVELFGFSTLKELNTYKLLININGVGPKAGISILSILSPEQVSISVASGDWKTITQANGVGPKMAQRIVLELKDKFKSLQVDDGEEFTGGGVAAADTGNIPQAVQALSVLGFSAADVTPILTKLDRNMSVEQMIGATLKKLGR
ncbi:MAG: Holliday junction branch migration protein RuvA [Oscillospiraceae bacterium]|nr:Holliday junction branch migration protein RuvA [Oscillospiraceae bacterium]